MLGLIIGVIAGAILLVGASTLLPESFRNAITVNLVRVAGALLIAVSILSTSFVHVPDGHLGQMFRIYGGSSLTEGRIVATNGENGPQAQILTPGFHFWPLVNVLYSVDTNPQEILIPSGKVGVLAARDGTALRAGPGLRRSVPGGDGLPDAGRGGIPEEWRPARPAAHGADARQIPAQPLSLGCLRARRQGNRRGLCRRGEVERACRYRFRHPAREQAGEMRPDHQQGSRICSGWMRRSCRSAASECGTSRCSRANIISIRTRFASPRSIPARRSGAIPAATSAPRSRSPSTPRATSCRPAPKSTCR